MTLERLSSLNLPLYNQAINLYKNSFPLEERRDDTEQERVLKKQAYHFDLIMDNGGFLGVMLYWEHDNFIFLEHFTTLPEVRGNGYGEKALTLLKARNKTIILEIEPPVDELSTRRFRFYNRNGFLINPYYHIQAKYHLGDEDLELKILTYPNVLTEQEYNGFYEYMTREIGILPNKSNDITIRPMQDGDDSHF